MHHSSQRATFLVTRVVLLRVKINKQAATLLLAALLELASACFLRPRYLIHLIGHYKTFEYILIISCY